MSQSDPHSGYVKVEPVEPHLPSQVFEAELNGINKRRAQLGIPPVDCDASDSAQKPHAEKGLVGLCLSGGGIRSSTFNLGVLQGLEKFGILPLVDYLSTVSGGGYIGSCLSSFFTTSKAVPFDYIKLCGLPPDATLSAGKRQENGDWNLTPDDLPGLTLQLAAQKNDESHSLTLRATGINYSTTINKESSIPLRSKSNPAIGLETSSSSLEDICTLTITAPGNSVPLSLPLFIGSRKYPFPFRHKPGNLESAPFRHLREYSNYLYPKTPFSFSRMPALFLRGVLVNSLIIIPVILVLAIFTTIFADNTIRNALATRTFDIAISYDLAEQDTPQVPDAGYRSLYLDLTPDVEWDVGGNNKYIILGGLPKNSYTNQGLFLSKGRWLFRDTTAESLKITMMIPKSEGDFTIKARAWQTDDTIEHQLQGVKEVYELTGLKIGQESTALQVKRTIVNRSEPIQLINVALEKNTSPLKTISLIDLISGLGLEKPGDDTNRFVMIENLTALNKVELGQYLTSESRVFKNDQISQLDLQIPLPSAAPGTDKNIKLVFWQSGNDSNILDPVDQILRTASIRTAIIFAIYGFILFLTILPVFLFRNTNFNNWSMRDVLSRWFCGGGLALSVVLGILTWQVPAIYFFYRIHYDIGPISLFGGADKMIMGTVTFLTMLSAVVSSLSPGSKKELSEKQSSSITNILSQAGMLFLGLMGPLMLWIFYLNLCGWALLPNNLPGLMWESVPESLSFLPFLAQFLDLPINSALVLSGYAAFYLFLRLTSRLFFNANDTSLHPFYRDRDRECICGS